MSMPCATEDCPNEARQDVDSGLCWACTAQKRRNGKAVGATPRHATTWERLTEAAINYADAVEQEEFARARDQLRKAAKAYGPDDHRHRTKAGMERAKAAGVVIHRPPKVTPVEVMEALKQAGSAKRASARLGISLRTLRRKLKELKSHGPLPPFEEAPVSALIRSRGLRSERLVRMVT